MTLISRTTTMVYDVDNDFDIEVERIDHIETEEVLAYVPAGSPFRHQVVEALASLAKDIDDRSLVDGSGNPPASP